MADYPITTYGYKRKDSAMRVLVTVPASGTFVLGKSLLNGSDVLGVSTTTKTYANEIVEITYNSKQDVTSGVFKQPIANTATIIIQSDELDPILNVAIHPGTRVTIEYSTSLYPATWFGLLYGEITDVQTIVNPNVSRLVYIEVQDLLGRLLNAPIGSYTRVAGSISDTLTNLVPIAITAAGMDSYGLTYNMAGSVAQHGALSYTNTTFGQIANDLCAAELGTITMYGQNLVLLQRDAEKAIGYNITADTTDLDEYTMGYSADYLFSDLNASLTSAPATVYTKSNTDVASFFGPIVQNTSVNLKDVTEMNYWLASITQYSPGIRCLNLSMPRFVLPYPGATVQITDNYSGASATAKQGIVDLSIRMDATSVSTQMTLWQPV